MPASSWLTKAPHWGRLDGDVGGVLHGVDDHLGGVIAVGGEQKRCSSPGDSALGGHVGDALGVAVEGTEGVVGDLGFLGAGTDAHHQPNADGRAAGAKAGEGVEHVVRPRAAGHPAEPEASEGHDEHGDPALGVAVPDRVPIGAVGVSRPVRRWWRGRRRSRQWRGPGGSAGRRRCPGCQGRAPRADCRKRKLGVQLQSWSGAPHMGSTLRRRPRASLPPGASGSPCMVRAASTKA